MSSRHLETGTVFAGDFRVLGVIAEGGMGTVYEVEQVSTHKRRALKLVRPFLVAGGKERQRFVREATVGASIDSAHVVEVIAAGIEGEVQPWLAMELLVGGDLGAVVSYAGPLSVEQLRETLRQLCHGLGAAHRAGVVHRDLKPAN
ncbi:MAG: protein kinase, partial [Myxococcota bacterium]